MHMVFGLKANERSFGVLLVWKCPQCEMERDFHLVARNLEFTLMHFFSTGKSKDTAYAHCAECGYDVKIDPSDAAKIEPIMERTAQFKSGAFSQEAYRESLINLDSILIQDLRGLTETWTCPKCGEENPQSFSQCWNCSEWPGASDSPEESDAPAPPNPGLGKGGNAWE